MIPAHVLVIGGGIGGLSTCMALREGGFDGRLTLVGAEPHLPYDRPPLSKDFMAGQLSEADIVLQPADWYEAQRIALHLGVAVVAMDPDHGWVELDDGSALSADTIVLATGGTPRSVDLPGALVLRTRDDALRLRGRLQPGTRLLVVGAGLIGAEVAASATVHGCAVTLIDPDPLPMAGAIGPLPAEILHRLHAKHGVTVVQTGLESLAAEADVVLMGIGIRPNVELAEASGLDTDNGVLVGADMRTSHGRVFAVGDIARPRGGVRVEHWENARRTGEIAARAILELPPEPAKAPWFWTDRYGIHVEMTGHYDPTATPITRGDASGTGGTGGTDGTIIYWRDGHCVGAVAFNRPLDIRAIQRMIDRGVQVDAARLADQSTDLRTLLKRG